MSINQHNYELFILDYYEGKLNAVATAELMLYLDQNPHAREAFETYEAIMLTPDLNQKFEPKSSLKKTTVVAVGELNEENYETYFIESIENNLSATQLADLNEFVGKNPQLKKTLGLYKSTILHPNTSIVFEGKDMLKRTQVVPLKRPPVYRLLAVSISVAAVLAVILISGILLRNIGRDDIRGSFAFSTANLNKSLRKPYSSVKQNTGSDNRQNGTNILYHPSNQNLTFADIDPAAGKINPDKLQIKRNDHIEIEANNDLTASIVMNKRNEYSDLISERELLMSRRKKETTSQDENLADYIVSGIKNAARRTSKNKDDVKNNNRLGFWDIAGFGVYAYNKITDNNLSLNKQTDASGRLISFNLEDNSDLSTEKK